MEWISALATLMTAIFTGLLWRVSKQQAHILSKQSQIQETLARSELEGLVFLELEPSLNRSPVLTTSWKGQLYAFRNPSSSISPLNGAMTMGHFLLHRPMARRPAQEGCSAARGVSTGVTSRRTGGRAR
jgi:hypothetical protein